MWFAGMAWSELTYPSTVNIFESSFGDVRDDASISFLHIVPGACVYGDGYFRTNVVFLLNFF